MPFDAIPFNASQSTGLEQLGGAAPYSINALVDATGTMRMRPGISAWSDFPTAIPSAVAVKALVPFGSRLVYATADNYWYSCEGAGVVQTLSSAATPTSYMEGTLRPQLLATRTRVVGVAGGVPQKWEGTGLSSRLGGSPPSSTHIAATATRLVMAPFDISGRIQWSGPGEAPGHETWDALNYAEAEARPDKIAAIADNTNELFAVGTETLQVFQPDATVDFAPGRALNIGMLAPYSTIKIDDNIAFFDRERRFVNTDGRTWNDAAPGLSKTFDEIGTVSDCWGFRATVDQWDLCTWMFPTIGKGYIWERGQNRWSEWRAFGSNGWQAPTITAAVAWPEQNLIMVGLSTGQVAKLDTAAYSDLGSPIKVEIVTGFVDRSTQNKKHCKGVNFRFKRGQTAQGITAPQVMISWRDDLGNYESPTIVDLGNAGDYDPEIRLRSLGCYRQRQWKLEFTSASELVFVGAQEEFEPLSS